MTFRKALVLLLCLALTLPFGVSLADSTDILNQDAEMPIVTAPITLRIFGQQGPIHADWATMDLFVEYQKRSGITLDFKTVPSQGYDEQKNLMFASGDYPDILVRAFLSGTEIVRYGSMGLLLPVEDLIPTYGTHFQDLMNQYPDIEPRIKSPDGHIYALPAVISMAAARTEKFWINTAWLEQVGLSIPTTFEELETVLRAFKGVDFNGNGEADELPAGVGSLSTWIANFCGLWGLQRQFGQDLNLSDGVVSEWMTSEAYRDLLRWTKNLYDEGLLDPDILTQEYSKFNAKMSGQVMGFFVNMADDAFDSTNYAGIAPFAGKSDSLYVKRDAVARDIGTFAIMSNCAYPEAALRWQDYFYSSEGSYLMRYGIEDKTWTRDENGLPVYVDGILNSPDGAGPAIAQFTIWPGGGSPQWLNDVNSIAVVTPTTAQAQVALEPYMDYELYAAPLFSLEINERLVILQKDINDYFNQCAAKFVKGDLDLEGADWDTYVGTLGKIGMEEFVQIYQDAYNNLNAM